MSIIQEALKKAQENYLKKAPYKKEPTQELFKDSGVASPKPERVVVLHHAAMPLPMMIPAVIILALLIGFGLKSFFSGRPADNVKESTSRQEVSLKQISKEAPVSQNSEDTQGIVPAADDIMSPIKRTLSSSFMTGKTPELVLNGIMYLQEGPKAIINSTVVREGDVISGATVKTINKNNVLLSFNDSEITLTLKE